MKIDIICPLFNASQYIVDLNKSLIEQKKVKINTIHYLLTESNDDSEKILKENKLDYKLIKKQDFSHSLTREKIAMKSEADILVFITQDIKIEDNLWLYNLTKNIGKNNIVASFSRQISKYNNIEKYTREKNYPDKSRVVSKKDVDALGLNTFFFSDASSAIKKDVFVQLNGYDHKDLPINEDMYIAHKIIMNGYKISYEADSIVYHSHKFSLKDLYNRYKLTGKFFKENSYLDNYGTNKAGGGLAKYILKRAVQDKNVKVLFRFLPDMASRFIGMKVGKNNGKQ